MTTVSKHIFLLRVRMEVYKHFYSILILHYVLLYCIDLLTSIKTSHSPAAVKVIASNVASRVTQNDPIGIDHWHYL